MKKNLKTIIIEKDENSLEIITAYLKETGYDMLIEKAENLTEAEKLIDDNALNLFICDVSDKEEESIIAIENIEKEHPNCKFLITSYGLKTDYIVRFLRSSKKDFIDKPVAKKYFIDVVTEIVEKMTSEQDFSGHGKVISVFSNKGGLGKTTIAINLASRLGTINPSDKIAIVDMNMFLGDVTTFLDMNPPYDMNFIIDKIDDNTKLSDIVSVYADSNIYVIADSPFREYNDNITKEAVLKLFNSLRKEFKYIIVDSSSAITGKTKNVFDISDLILLISEANLPVLNNCKRCLDFFERIGKQNKVELILNRYSDEDACEPSDIENVLQKEIFAKIPNDWNTVTDSVNRGLTIGECYPDTDIYYAYVELTEAVIKKLCQ
ncbi:MAG: AAA family ATPase [Candidatus Gastranaerophilaceae bacterium]